MKKKVLISVLIVLLVLVLTIVGIIIGYKIKKDKENEVYVWQGKYIWFDEGDMTVVNDPKEIKEGYKNRENANTWASFRKNFVIENKRDIKNVLARIVVDSKYWLYINDNLVVKDGAVKRGETPLSTYYDEVDITPYLNEGENTISILVWYFGRTGFSHIDSTHGAMLFETKIGDEYLVSDSSWKCIQNPAFLKDDVVNNSRLSESGIYYDARLEIENWYKKDFDDSLWENAREYGNVGDYPWGALYERDIPQYTFSEIIEYENFDKYKNYIPAEDELIELKLPYNMQIIPYLKVESEEGKEIIITYDSNYLEKGKKYKVRYITKEGMQEFESYGWLNSEKMYYFIPAGVKIISLGYIHTGYDTTKVGSFESNDEFLNTLWEMSARTLYVNMRDTYMDCPDRERALWWGDASISMKQAMYVFDDNANLLYDKCIDMLLGWKQDKVLLTVTPPERNPMHLPVQMLLSVSAMYDYYTYTGDIEFLAKIYPHVKDYLSLWEMSDQDGLMKLKDFYALWPWGDSVGECDYTAVENMWYYYALTSCYKMAEELGYEEDRIDLKEKVDSVNESLNKNLWKDDGYKSNEKEFYDVRANAIAVLSGLADESKYEKIYNVLWDSTDNSPFMEYYILEAMIEIGNVEDVQNRIKTRYENMVSDIEYSSTLWEYWDNTTGSKNHTWSGGPLVIMSKYFAGIEPLKPGYEEILIKPRNASLKEIKATTNTKQGMVSVSINKEEDKLNVNIDVPTKTLIAVEKMTENPQIIVNNKTVYENGKSKNRLGIKVDSEDDKYIYIYVNKGKYVVESK